MRLGAFLSGSRLSITGRKLTLLKRTEIGTWQVEYDNTRELDELDDVKLQQFYQTGDLVFLPSLKDPRGEEDEEERASLPIGYMSDADREYVTFKIEFLREMSSREYPGWHAKIIVHGVTTSGFAIALAEVSALLGRKRPVSPSTFYEWRGECQIYGEDPSELRRRKRCGREMVDPRAKRIFLETMLNVVEEHCSPRRPVGLKPLKKVEIFTLAYDEIKLRNKEIEKDNRFARLNGRTSVPLIELPKAKSTLYDWWEQFPAKDRKIVEKGPEAARHDHRGGRGKPRTEACLDHVEYDEWHSNIVIFDEDCGAVYGRPWLSWFYCGYSQLPLGFYLGFEQQSDLCLMSALRASCLPKAFLSEEFPGVGIYPVFGIPRLMIFDNGLAQHGKTIKLASYDLRNRCRFTPKRTGWFKPHVEGSFKVINQELIQTLPGSLMPGVAKSDYDPHKHGCLGFRSMMQLLWIWIINVHATADHTEFNNPRLDVWRESCERYPPSLIADKRGLDELFWVLREGKLDRNCDHRGVWFESLRYYSPELDYLRDEFGAHTKVAIKVNPADLEFLLVRAHPDAPWFRVQAVDDTYARGRSLMQHQACRKAALAVRSTDSVHSWLEAQSRLRHALHELLTASSSIAMNRIAAKLWGIGTQHMTAAIDHKGLISGSPAHTPGLPRTPRQLTNLSVLDQTVNAGGSTEIAVYDADLSLGARGNRR